MKLKNLVIFSFLFAGAFRIDAMPLKPLSMLLIYSYISPTNTRLIFEVPSEELSESKPFFEFEDEENIEEIEVEEGRELISKVYLTRKRKTDSRKTHERLRKVTHNTESELDLKQEEEEYLYRLFDNSSYPSMDYSFSFSMGSN